MRTLSEKARETAIAQVTDWSRGWREISLPMAQSVLKTNH